MKNPIVTQKVYSHGRHVGFIKPVRSKWWRKANYLMVLDTNNHALGTANNYDDALRMVIGFDYNRTHRLSQPSF